MKKMFSWLMVLFDLSTFRAISFGNFITSEGESINLMTT